MTGPPCSLPLSRRAEAGHHTPAWDGRRRDAAGRWTVAEVIEFKLKLNAMHADGNNPSLHQSDGTESVLAAGMPCSDSRSRSRQASCCILNFCSSKYWISCTASWWSFSTSFARLISTRKSLKRSGRSGNKLMRCGHGRGRESAATTLRRPAAPRASDRAAPERQKQMSGILLHPIHRTSAPFISRSVASFSIPDISMVSR